MTTLIKSIAIVIVSVVLSIVAFKFLPTVPVEEKEQNFGANTAFSGIKVEDDGITRGTVLASTTSGTAATLSATILRQYQQFTLTPNVASHTLTLPASTSLVSFLPVAGETAEFFVQNGTSTAAVTLTLATATGLNLKRATTTLAIPPSSVGILRFVRLTNKDFNVLFSIAQ